MDDRTYGRDFSPERDEEQGLDVAEFASNFLRIARRMWWLFLVFVAVGVGCLYAVSYVNYTPLYRSEATFTITSGDGSSLFSSVNSASQLSRTFPYVLDSSYFRGVLEDELGTDTLDGTIEARTIENSNMVTMWVDSASPESARAILEKALEVYPEVSRFVLGDIAFNLIDDISTPTAPVNEPSQRRIWGFGVMGGVCAAALVVGLVALFNNTIKSAEDLESVSSMVCLGALPEVRAKARKKSAASRYVSALDKRVSHGFRESARAMGARVRDALAEHGGKTVLVTSSVADEGKSTVAINLAEQLAQDGSRVLLIDMDLRSQGDAALLGCGASHGPAEVLEDPGLGVDDSIVTVEESGIGFWGGSVPVKNAVEILSDERLPVLLDELRGKWDYIVLDASPCGMFQDAAMLANWTDEVLFVVRFDRVGRRNVQEALSMLDGERASVLGYVLNGCPQTTGSYGYGYGRYGYGKYGYGSYGDKYARLVDEVEEGAAAGAVPEVVEDEVTLPRGKHWRV